MILAPKARGPGFKSRTSPIHFVESNVSSGFVCSVSSDDKFIFPKNVDNVFLKKKNKYFPKMHDSCERSRFEIPERPGVFSIMKCVIFLSS